MPSLGGGAAPLPVQPPAAPLGLLVGVGDRARGEERLGVGVRRLLEDLPAGAGRGASR
jgi:hypothetical protein